MRKTWILFIAFILMSIGVLSGCTQQQSPPAGNTVTMKNLAFNPSTITIKAGENVTWTNEDSVSHTVKEVTGLFESSTLVNGQSFTFTFTTTGTYNYTCTIHPSMKGKVIVE
jgi:amicyanin